jgi:hypothetical protein
MPDFSPNFSAKIKKNGKTSLNKCDQSQDIYSKNQECNNLSANFLPKQLISNLASDPSSWDTVKVAVPELLRKKASTEPASVHLCLLALEAVATWTQWSQLR